MHWYIIVSIAALLICLFSCLYHFARLMRLGRPGDFSRKTGNTTRAIKYSFTGAMSPGKKESAYLHLPTYTAGLIYHTGTFLAIILFFFLLARFEAGTAATYIFSAILLAGALSGTGILIKRMAVSKLRNLSCADDYISNILVTAFQYVSILELTGLVPEAVYFMTASLLLIYVPLGKLRHLVYFFAARYQLGFFYGWRNAWPPSKNY
ncbi:MAG: hypothetical protein V2I34_04090 [Bacteroidales bacterium]|jgi:hypothetical protein|nr:hypothetical protein [Bacteroidales bacterium]